MGYVSTPSNLGALADRIELGELVSRLGRWLDDPTSGSPGSLLADDVSVRSPGGESRGRRRVVAQARRTHAAAVTQHAMTDILTTVDGDAATITANLVVTFVAGDGVPSPRYQAGARYRFGARRTADGWRLTRIDVEPVWEVGVRPTADTPDVA